MNRALIIIMCLGITTICIMIVIPPWQYDDGITPYKKPHQLGYSFICKPPMYYRYVHPYSPRPYPPPFVEINKDRLLIQIMLVIVLTGIGCMLTIIDRSDFT